MCISVSFAKFLREPIQENICKRLLLKIGNFSFVHSFISFEVQSCRNQMVRAGDKRAVYDNCRKIMLKGKLLQLLLVSRQCLV